MVKIGAMAVLVLVGLTGRVPIHAQSEEKYVPSISVVGHGKISAVPNVADLNLGVVTQAATAKDALAKNNESMTNLHKVLKEHGIPAKDIETTQIQVNPVYNQPGPRDAGNPEFVPKVVGYRVSNSVEVTVRKVDKLGELLDLVVEAGANQVNGISFRVENAEHLLDEARKRAMADAKGKAELLAGEAKMVLGLPRQIVEMGGNQPRPYSLGLPMAQPMMRSAVAPVAPGEQELSISIQVSYAILPPKA